MANRYIRHGATFNGDGTSSNLATVDGGVGAWNTITYLEGTTPAFGSIAAGDVVYIRSKDEAGSDITRVLSANVTIGSAASTATNPIVWILDNGTVWDGISGVLTYRTTTTTTRAVVIRAHNRLIASTRGNIVSETLLTSPGDGTYLVALNDGSYAVGIKTVSTAVTSASPRLSHFRQITNGFSYIEDPICKVGLMNNGTDGNASVFSTNSIRGTLVIINPDVELTSSVIFQHGVFDAAGTGTYNKNLEIRGGRIYGVGAQSGQNVFCVSFPQASQAMRVMAIGLQFPRAMDVINGGSFNGYTLMTGMIELIGCDEGGIGGHLEAAWGWATSRTDNNPPYLSAALPNSTNTPWAWRVWPRVASQSQPVRLPCMKIWTADPKVVTITQELLVSNTLPSATKQNTWITVEYTDNATGLPRSVSSIDYSNTVLDTSTAPWSATTWGIVSLLKRRIQIVTPTAVKKDSPIIVTFNCGLPAVNADDILFLDPDFSAV